MIDLYTPPKPVIIRVADDLSQSTFPIPMWVPASPAVTIDVPSLGGYVNSVNASSYTTGALDIGAAPAFGDRDVFVCVQSNISHPTAITLAGVSILGNVVSQQSSGAVFSSIYVGRLNTGTTAVVAVTYGATQSRCGVRMVSAYNLLSTAYRDANLSTNVAGASLSVTTLDKGFVLGVVAFASTTNRTFTWTSLNEAAGFGWDETIESAGTTWSGATALSTGADVTAVVTPSGSATNSAVYTLMSFR